MLDTKLKSSSVRKGAGLFVSVVLLSLLATAVLLFYRPIVENAKDIIKLVEASNQVNLESYKQSQENDFLGSLYKGNYVLKWELERQKNNKKFSAEDVFLNNSDGVGGLTGDTQDETGENFENFKNDFSEMMNNWYYDFFYTTLPGYQLEYYVQDNDTKAFLTNTGAKLSSFLEAGGRAEDIRKQYAFYTVIQFDKDGNINMPYFQGIPREKEDTYLAFNLTQAMVERSWNNAAWYASRVKKLSGMTVIYAVKSDSFLQNEYLRENGYASYQIINEAYNKAGAAYLYAITIMLVVLLGLLLPAVKPLGIGKGIEARVPLEVWGIGIIITFAIYSEGILPLIKETVSGDLFALNSNHIFTEGTARAVVNIFNILVWLSIFLIWFVATLSIRELFIKRPARYLKENTLSFRFLFWLGSLIKKAYRYVTSIDMSKKDNKKLIIFLGANMLIMIVLCAMWGVGIFGAIVYTGVLYYFINKHKNKIASDYKTITEAAERITEGNLEVTIERDLGVFNPLKEQLMMVQQGFRKAVLEETRSQKMKTELITNVSHDLKTPLTAIITYVDLLKDRNLTEEQRDSYIETLDRKALRLKILIEDLFEMSKAASNTISINPVEVDLTALIKQLHFELSDRIERADIDFRVRMPEDKVVAKLDSDKTYRIFENLLINMCKYTLPGSRAYLDMEVQEKQVSVTVRNISQAELDFSGEEIVERFVRGDKARNSEGSGLGLAIAKSFTELQGGNFQVVTDGDLFKVVVEFRIL